MASKQLRKEVSHIQSLDRMQDHMYSEIQKYQSALELFRKEREGKALKQKQRKERICLKTGQQIIQTKTLYPKQVREVIRDLFEYQQLSNELERNISRRMQSINQIAENNDSKPKRAESSTKKKIGWHLNRKLREFEVKQNKARLEKMHEYELNRQMLVHQKSFK